jgi:hypothetical protein
LDDTKLLGLRHAICYLEYCKIGSRGIAAALREKLDKNKST